jgi:uncharacterized membrane protein YecN with MAPEG domain
VTIASEPLSVTGFPLPTGDSIAMTFPYITAATAGFVLILQMFLGLAVSAARGKSDTWVGDGGNAQLLRASRRHANLAENGAIDLLVDFRSS